MRRRFLTTILCLLLGVIPITSAAAEKAMKPSVKAAYDIIDSMPEMFKDLKTTERKMSQEEIIDFVLTKAGDTIQEKIADKFKEEMQERLKNYALKNLRLYTYQQVVWPMVNAAYDARQKIDWFAIDSEISRRVDSRVATIGAAWTVVKISWSAIDAYKQKNALAAAKVIGGAVGEILAEAYLPGYGWVKLGAEATKALGEYVIESANQWGAEGVFKEAYPEARENPQGFAKWLVDKSEAQIAADLNERFNDGGAIDGLLEPTSDSKYGSETLDGRKKRIVGMLVGMRKELVDRIAVEKEARKEFESHGEKIRQEAETSQKEVEAVAAKATAAATTYLAKIREFRSTYYPMKKEEVKQEYAAVSGQASTDTGVPYLPLQSSVIVKAYSDALEEVKDFPSDSGFDRLNYDNQMKEYERVKVAEVSQFIQANNEALDAWDRVVVSSQKYSTLQQRLDVYWAAQARIPAEIKLIDENLALADIDADERGLTLGQKMRDSFDQINLGIAAAAASLDIELNKNRNQSAQLNFVSTHETGENPVDETTLFTAPGQVGEIQQQHLDRQDGMKKDMALLADLFKQQLSAYQQYFIVARNAYALYRTSVPKNLQVIKTPTYAYQGENLDRVVSPLSEAFPNDYRELWSVGGFPHLTILPESLSRGVIPLGGQSSLEESLKRVMQAYDLQYRNNIARIETSLSVLRPFLERDRQAVAVNRLAAKTYGELAGFEYTGAGPGDYILMFRINPAVCDDSIPVATAQKGTRGYLHLEKMKKAWAENQGAIANLVSLAKGYRKLKYENSDPQQYLDRLDSYVRIPDQIKTLEAAMQLEVTATVESLVNLRKEIAKLRADFESSKGGDGKLQDLVRMKAVENSIDTWLKWLGKDYSECVVRAEVLVLRKEIDDTITRATAQNAKAWEEHQRQEKFENQQRAAEESERKRQEVTARDQQEQARHMPEKIREFYARFGDAYESRNDSLIMSLVGDDWQAGDGTTLADLQTNLSRTFRLFDEVKYRITNLNIFPGPQSHQIATYDVTITSRIYRRNIKHVESSQVSEELAADDRGVIKIVRTLNGRFWYVE